MEVALGGGSLILARKIILANARKHNSAVVWLEVHYSSLHSARAVTAILDVVDKHLGDTLLYFECVTHRKRSKLECCLGSLTLPCIFFKMIEMYRVNVSSLLHRFMCYKLTPWILNRHIYVRSLHDLQESLATMFFISPAIGWLHKLKMKRFIVGKK